MKNPTVLAARQGGFGKVSQAKSRTISVTAPLEFQPKYDPIAWLSQRAGVAPSTARAYAEIHKFGGANA